VLFSYTVVAQELKSLKKDFQISFPEKIQKLVLDPLPAGTYSIGAGGYFATIQSAFDKLGNDGIAGEVILELIDNLYTAPTNDYGFLLNGPIPGAGPNSRVTIKPASNKNVTIEGNGLVTVSLLNTSYITIDGVALTGSTTLTVHTLPNNAYIYNDGVDFISNSDHNVMQNIVFINEDGGRGSGSGFVNDNPVALSPDSNLIQNNFVKQAGVGLYTYGNPDHIANGNIIRGNIIGTETDSLIAFGIFVLSSQNAIVENNIIQNLTRANSWGDFNAGIFTLYDSGDIIRNNIVHNIKSSSGYSSVGIFLSGENSYVGSNNSVYNNMVYDIRSTSTLLESHTAGIQAQFQNNSKIYYNTVYLSGTGENRSGSAALYIYQVCTNIEAKNNIFVNTRDESTHFAASIYSYSDTNLTSDYNDLYCDTTNINNCLVIEGETNYTNLASWQVTGNDLHSYVEMPHFVDPYLEIDPSIATYLESRGIPISGITTDYENDVRNALTPDIGADEFDGILVGVEDEKTLPTVFALEQNYPNPFNPSTKISWQSPVGSMVTLKVYDVLGNEIATLVNEYKSSGKYEVEFNASTLPSGIYFYQLKAGGFVNTKKMILMK